jgi:queuosine precursor transporter
VFTQARWIQICSMAAFLIGNLTDISVFFLIKKATGNRFLWLRATGSTAVSQLIDTIIITSLLFGRKRELDDLVVMIITSYAIKLTAAIVATPIIYALHEVIEKRFGIHPADHPVND